MLSKTADYALRAAICLAEQKKSGAISLSAELLAERTRVPRRYLHRVLQDLAAHQIIESRPGPGGGYSLAKEPSSIDLLQVVNAVSPIERIRYCPLGISSHTSLCPLHAELDRAYAQPENAFAGVTLQELLDSTSKVKPLCEE
jgi:Rrf2 family protein